MRKRYTASSPWGAGSRGAGWTARARGDGLLGHGVDGVLEGLALAARNPDAGDYRRDPEPRYVMTEDGVYIAYQVVGEGPVDISLEHAWLGGLELMWEDPYIAAAYDALASFSRLILHDRRATGLEQRRAASHARDARRGSVGGARRDRLGAHSPSWVG